MVAALPNQMVHMSRHVFTLVAVAVFSLSVLGPPVQAQDSPFERFVRDGPFARFARELAGLRALTDLYARAGAGATEAQCALGYMYLTGEGVPQDFAEGVRWFRLAAEQGHALAQCVLGAMYYFGAGVPQNFAEAVRWSRLGAEQGQAVAQYVLGLIYYWGKGVPHNNVEAYMWLNLAASRLSGAGREESVAVRDRAAQLMTPADLSEAQRLAREWHAAHTVP